MTKKIVIFVEEGSHISYDLLKGALNQLPENLSVVAIVNTAKMIKTYNPVRNYISFLIRKSFNPTNRNIYFLKQKSAVQFAHSQNIPVIDAPNINDTMTVEAIKKYAPDIALIFGCPQILKADLIHLFDQVINYHNSYLPNYKGLYATSWEMTHKEEEGGYSFHAVNEKIDDGRVILQNKIQLDYSKTAHENEVIKTNHAVTQLPNLFKLILNGAQGKLQKEKGQYFGQKAKNELLRFDNLNNVKHINQLITIWGYVELPHQDGSILKITAIDKNGKIYRIRHLPPFLYRFLSFMMTK